MAHPRLSRSAAVLCASALIVAAGALAGCAAGRDAGPPAAAPAGPVRVTHADLDRLVDERGGLQESEQARLAWVDALSGHLAERAAALLAEGQRLDVHLARVQRAGGFEPWYGPRANELRIVRDIYPPRIDLDFKLLATDGSVLREGQRSLRSGAFMMRPNVYPSDDPLRYEKVLIDDWLRQELGGR